MDLWTPLGAHRYRVEGDILWVETHGEFTAGDLEQYVGIYQRLLSTLPVLGILADVSGGVSSSPSVRKRASDVLRPKRQRVPIAIVGASLPVRTIYSLFTNAQRLIFGISASNGFFADLAQGRTWLELQLAECRLMRALAPSELTPNPRR